VCVCGGFQSREVRGNNNNLNRQISMLGFMISVYSQIYVER
jgi:hypothetical protein